MAPARKSKRLQSRLDALGERDRDAFLAKLRDSWHPQHRQLTEDAVGFLRRIAKSQLELPVTSLAPDLARKMLEHLDAAESAMTKVDAKVAREIANHVALAQSLCDQALTTDLMMEDFLRGMLNKMYLAQRAGAAAHAERPSIRKRHNEVVLSARDLQKKHPRYKLSRIAGKIAPGHGLAVSTVRGILRDAVRDGVIKDSL